MLHIPHPPAAALRLHHRPLRLAAHLADIAQAWGAPFLFERADGPSLLIERSALDITVRGEEVSVEARTPLGATLIAPLARTLVDNLVQATPGALTLRFARSEAYDPETRLKAPSFLDTIRALTTGLEWTGEGAPVPPLTAGVLAFDHVDHFEELPPNPEDPAGFPDALFLFPERLLVVEPDGTAHALLLSHELAADALDHFVRAAEGMTPAPPPPGALPATATVDLDDPAFYALVETMQEHIAAGDVFQVVPSRSFTAPCPDPRAAFARLRAINPSPAMFYARHGDWTLFGASPETAVRVSGGRVELRPIAGTRRRGATSTEDAALEAELLADMKELAEHMMLVDLARNDVARVSLPGTREVSELLAVERYAHVMHLVSRVTGRLRPDLDALHALQACMNMGTLSGAPKLRATELLRRYERARRGPYGGAIGWFAADGAFDSAIVIRSALVQHGLATVRAGAGIVHDSIPQAEADETRRKAASVLHALGVEAA